MNIGDQFGEWTVLAVGPKRRRTRDLTRCSCGSEKWSLRQNLENGATTMCRSCSARRRIAAGHHNKTHGEAHRTPEHRTWRAMRERCNNPKNIAYARYGGAGVTVAEEWGPSGGFERFLAHVGRRPSPRHSIDRIDGARGYEPGNVRWATRETQARNRSCSHFIEAFGERLCIAEWAERSGLSQSTIILRVKRGWDPERVVSAPVVPGSGRFVKQLAP